MRVYRFERNGYGPYTYKSPTPPVDKKLNEQIDRHEAYDWHSRDKWPTAMADNIPYYCAIGCPSLAELTSWFDGMLGSLVRCGFRIRVYEIPEEYIKMGRSGKQLGFYHTDIMRVIR